MAPLVQQLTLMHPVNQTAHFNTFIYQYICHMNAPSPAKIYNYNIMTSQWKTQMGHIRIVEKAQETSSDTGITGYHTGIAMVFVYSPLI